MSLMLKVRSALALGLVNLLRVAVYKAGVLTGLNPVRRLKGVFCQDPWFVASSQITESDRDDLGAGKQISVDNRLVSFSAFDVAKHPIPSGIDWYRSVLTDQLVLRFNRPWFHIPDFNPELGDIKGVWEASRFSWLFPLAREVVVGNDRCLDILNKNLQSWASANPPYLGPNWKCGQEASIRVMHLAMVASLLEQESTPTAALMQAIKLHLQRIAPTLMYAIAQDNNHGTSEAAALFIGGTWLVQQGDTKGKYWAKIGRKWLENRAFRLIAPDGSFSQYSTNYHRVMLDTYVMVEVWRRRLFLPSFSCLLIMRLQAATNWLYQLTDPVNGDVPNLGANDGARLLPLTDTDYRDFRPSVQLAAVLFFGRSAYARAGKYDEPLKWLRLAKPEVTLPPLASFHFPDGGYAGLRGRTDQSLVVLNYPKFRFRPSQCDALHIDFWLDGENLLRDGGTFSYNAGDDYICYYGGVESHNTVQFDYHDQMPRLSRFLLGNWLCATDVQFDESGQICQAAYRDSYGANHQRRVILADSCLTIIDDVSGFKKNAVLRWRLKPSNWMVSDCCITDGRHTILIQSDVLLTRLEITQGRESRYYYQESQIPVVEIELASAGRIITEIRY